MTSVICGVCALKITAENDRVYCFGGCDRILHVKCSDLKSNAITALTENISLKFICFDCRKQQLKLNDIQRKCNDLFNILNDMNKANDNLIQQVSTDIMQKTSILFDNKLKDLESSVSDRITKRLCDFLKSNATASNTFSDNSSQRSYATVTRSHLDEPTTAAKRKADSAPVIDQPCRKKSSLGQTVLTEGGLLRSGKRRIASTTDIDKQTESFNSQSTLQPPLGASAVKPKSVIRIEQSVLIKPKINQNPDITKQDVCNQLDPVSLAIKEVFFKPNGEAILRCNSHTSSTILLETATKSLGDKYEAEMQKALKPRLRISGFANKIEEVEFLSNLRKQNELPNNAEIKFIRSNSSSVIIETDALTFEKLINLRRVNIGWERCSVREFIDVLRCFHCAEYGHIASSCTKPVCCPKCAGGHERKDCTSSYAKCINCHNANSSVQNKDVLLDVDHPSWSPSCPIQQQRIKKKRQRIDYSS